MDLLFKRYASPFLLLDTYISNGALLEFITNLFETVNQEIEDDVIWDMWLHKCWDKDFSEFKAAIDSGKNQPTGKDSNLDDAGIQNIIDDLFSKE